MNSDKFHFWRISLIGKEPYGLKIGDMIWDISTFRPDPQEYLSPDKIYDSKIKMEKSHLYSGREVYIPREIWIPDIDKSFINMR